ncbi:MAG: hypothetical protein AB7V56_13850 [Candidatus Nitrosocosmicus sp.]
MTQAKEILDTRTISRTEYGPYRYSDYYDLSPAYRNFVNSLKTPATKMLYEYSIKKFYLSLPQNQNLSIEKILEKPTKTIEYELIDCLYDMKEKQKLSYSTLNIFVSAMFHFFEINDVVLNRRKIKKFRGDNIAKYEYRSYTHEEINEVLQLLDLRGKTTVLLMASTGMRVGALPDIKLKHLRRWNIENTRNHIYQITVYASSIKSKYTTFTTPEAAKTIDEYLDYRRRNGDRVKQDPETGNWTPGDSFLLIKNFDKDQQGLLCLSPSAIFNLPIQSRSITHAIVDTLRKLGKREKLKLLESEAATKPERQSAYSKHRNELHPCHSLRIFAVTQMQRAKVDKTIREMLVGHTTGLDKVYYKPQNEEILQEYLKAIDLLTISNENRLKKQVDYYKERENDLARMSVELAEIKQKLGI